MLGIIQARMGSSRLPGKVLRQLGDREVLAWVVRAAREAGCLDRLVVATTTLVEDDPIADLAGREAVDCVRGPVDDVLARFLLTLDEGGDDDVMRLTSDCPLVDPVVVREVAEAFNSGGFDYVGTGPPETLPRGFDVEILTAAALRTAGAEAAESDRTHVTSFVWRHPQRFRQRMVAFAPRADDLRVTLDTEEDWHLLTEVVDRSGGRPGGWREIVALLRADPELASINREVRQRSIGEP